MTSQKNLNWKAEERVFDTWMDSSISELYILKYLSDDEFFKRAYPATLRPQGKEIVRTWLYYTLLRGYLETNELPFKEVWIHQHILDAQGKKMSKSAGNGIDPQDILKTHGAEAFRLWAALEGNLAKQDLKCSMDRIGAETKTINKLLNVAKFIIQFKKPSKVKLTKTDSLFINYMESETESIDKDYEKYNFHAPAEKLRHFLWEVLASHYVEMIKNRVYNEKSNFSKKKKEKTISLKEPITGIKIPASLKAFESDLRACHHLQ